MKTLVTLQVALTEADISQNLTISIFLGTVETNFIQIMCEKRDRSTSEVSVFANEQTTHDFWICFFGNNKGNFITSPISFLFCSFSND
jgi:hypothetical protein